MRIMEKEEGTRKTSTPNKHILLLCNVSILSDDNYYCIVLLVSLHYF